MSKPEVSVNLIKVQFKPGMRVRLIRMDDCQAPPPGTIGIVQFVDDMGTIHVKWQNGSTLGLIMGEDEFERLGW